MDIQVQVLTKVGSLFLMILVGALARFRKIITDEALDNLCRIVLGVTLPFLFIYILSSKCTKDAFFALWTAPFIAGSIILVGYLIARFAASLLKLPPKRRDTFTFLVSFQNSGFLAIPIGFVLFGEDGVLAIVMFTLGFNILYWTLGIWLMGRSRPSFRINPVKNLLNPAIIALFLGIIFGYHRVNLPPFFLDASRLLGSATIPLAMLVVGTILASGGFKKGAASFGEISSIIFCRLIFIPIIYLIIVGFFKDIPQLLRSIIILQACMPSASTSPLLAKRFGGDYDLAASGVFFTTLFSIITVPLFMSLI